MALQIGFIPAIAVYLGYCRVAMRRRNKRSWESLIARLSPDLSARSLSEHFPWKEGLNATPDETWERIHGARGLWAMYKNAGVMQEMADFAAENCESIDRTLLLTLRSDATQIRVSALKALFQCLVNNASESVRLSAFQTASMYTGMAARMTQLIQDSASPALPQFVGAM
ncbi:MAG: hypothetical protein WCA11_12525 [Terracidiphilus sp.]